MRKDDHSGAIRVHPGSSGFIRRCGLHGFVFACPHPSDVVRPLGFLAPPEAPLRGRAWSTCQSQGTGSFFAIPLLENSGMLETPLAVSVSKGLPVIHNHNRFDVALLEQQIPLRVYGSRAHAGACHRAGQRPDPLGVPRDDEDVSWSAPAASAPPSRAGTRG